MTMATSTAAAAASQPDIAYHPDLDKYRNRTALRLRLNSALPNTPLPAGWPSRLDGPIIWEGKDWTNESQWVYTLTIEELKEIDQAIDEFKRKTF